MPAYELTYGDVELSLPNDRVLIDRATFGDLEGVSRPYWTGLSPDPHELDFAPIRKVELCRLYWPRGASKFAMGYFLASEEQLSRIRDQAYTGDSRGNIALPFVMSDKNGSITTDLYLVGEQRPLYQWDTQPGATEDEDGNLYVITLVDARYWWMFKSAEIEVTSGQSWASLYSAIASALGVSIEVDTVASAYLAPAQELVSKYRYIPPLLDAVAYSCGQRIIRKLDGTVIAQNAETARLAVADLWGEFAENTLGGGDFRFDRTSSHVDLASLVPSKVRMVFPTHQTTETKDPQKPCAEKCTDDQYTVDTELFDLNLSLYAGVLPKSGVKTLQSTAIAWYYQTSLRNSSELNSLAQQMATDWYTWQAIGDQSRIIPSIVEWTGEAANDFVEWQCWPKPSTMVVREAVNDLVLYVFHQSTRPAPDHSSGPPGSSGAPFTGSWLSYITECEGGFNHRYYQVLTLDFTTFAISSGPWIFESVQGCCNCWPFTSSSGPDGSSGPPTNNECVSGTTNGIPWLIQKKLKLYLLYDGAVIDQRTLTYNPSSHPPRWENEDETNPCAGEIPNLVTNAWHMYIQPDGSGFRLEEAIIDDPTWSGQFVTYVPMPPFGAGFSLEGPAAYPGNGTDPGVYMYCNGIDLSVPGLPFTQRIVGESCLMPPPSDECIPGLTGAILWLLPPEMTLQLWRIPLGTEDPVIVLQQVIRNDDQSDTWLRMGAETHPCDAAQPDLDLDAIVQIDPSGATLNLQMVIRDSSVEIVNMTGSVAMPDYGTEIYDDTSDSTETFAEDTLCENDATDEFFFRLVAVPCQEFVAAVCCPDDLVPETLYTTVNLDYGGGDVVQVPLVLTYDADTGRWYGSADCVGCTVEFWWWCIDRSPASNIWLSDIKLDGVRPLDVSDFGNGNFGNEAVGGGTCSPFDWDWGSTNNWQHSAPCCAHGGLGGTISGTVTGVAP